MKPRYLTKSRFKLALECPTKLYYTKKEAFENQSESDPFLEALAEGGFQVEELARMYYPDGVAILGDDWNYDLLATKTSKLLQRENVVIFEAAFLFDGLFIRVDILEKKRNQIKLIEVKAKSIEEDHESFLGVRGGLNAGWSTYLYDVAFQQYVIQQCYPDWRINPYLKLVNKNALASVDGINQFFKITKSTNLRTGITKKPGLKLSDLGTSLLANINISEEIDLIYKQNPSFKGQDFQSSLDYLKHHYREDIKIITPIGKQCKGCEFYDDSPEKSGFHQCWKDQLKISNNKIMLPKTYDIWNFRRAKKLIEEGKYFVEDLTESDIDPKPEAGQLSNSERQWIQVEKIQQNDETPYIELEGLKSELNSWKFPLNFIDFETSMVALPFTKGRKPYEQIAFQFSHHVVYKNGEVVHHSEYLNSSPGIFPNFEFLRALKKALEHNDGSIFRYHNHENTVLNQIHDQLEISKEPDKEELQSFIEKISHSTGKNSKSWEGERNMIDLYQVVKKYYYHPGTHGSISIKAILPAVLNASSYLQERYSNPLRDIGLSSKNFDMDHCFITKVKNQVISPYKMLPPLFEGWNEEDLEELVSEMGLIADGGAALTTFSKLQFENMSDQERDAISKGLLKYCELDTLAMVMIYEYFNNITKQ